MFNRPFLRGLLILVIVLQLALAALAPLLPAGYALGVLLLIGFYPTSVTIAANALHPDGEGEGRGRSVAWKHLQHTAPKHTPLITLVLIGFSALLAALRWEVIDERALMCTSGLVTLMTWYAVVITHEPTITRRRRLETKLRSKRK